jgi:hypothetical protein
MSRSLLKALAVGAASLLALLGVAGARAWSAGTVAMEESNLALARGDLKHAITGARAAAEAAVPFSPYPDEGYARLASIARAAEQKGDPDLASFAWRAMRSAATATLPATAAQGRVAEANDGILRLAHAPLATSAATGLATRGADESVVRGELASDETPSPSLPLLSACAALAVAATLASAARALRNRVPVA